MIFEKAFIDGLNSCWCARVLLNFKRQLEKVKFRHQKKQGYKLLLRTSEHRSSLFKLLIGRSIESDIHAVSLKVALYEGKFYIDREKSCYYFLFTQHLRKIKSHARNISIFIRNQLSLLTATRVLLPSLNLESQRQ